MVTKTKTAVVKAEAADEIAAKKKKTAEIALRPSVNAAVVMDSYAGKTFGEIGLRQLIDSLSESMTEINGGNMKRVEDMLFGQAEALQSIFVNLARRAVNQEHMKQYETHLRLALKAQSQCRATLETLAAIKNPPIVFAKQANIANGHQQINNGTAAPSPAREDEIEQSKLMEAQHGNYVDTRTTGATVGSYQEVEAVGTLDGAKVGRG